MIEKIRDQLIDNTAISNVVKPENIRLYQWTDETRVSYPFILIVPTSPPMSGVHSSNKELSMTLTYDIHVQTDHPNVTKQLMTDIHKDMKSMGFGQLAGGVDDYFQDVKKYVQARRYRINTRLYDTEY